MCGRRAADAGFGRWAQILAPVTHPVGLGTNDERSP
jgi:hypothetical protein